MSNSITVFLCSCLSQGCPCSLPGCSRQQCSAQGDEPATSMPAPDRCGFAGTFCGDLKYRLVVVGGCGCGWVCVLSAELKQGHQIMVAQEPAVPELQGGAAAVSRVENRIG